MLLSFTLGNFRSFKEPVMLSMKPIAYSGADESFRETHLIKTEHPKIPHLLKSAAIYGANASGKSNLLMGLMEMRRYALGSLHVPHIFRVKPFAFTETNLASPVSFEIRALIGSDIYRYGFEVHHRTITGEWLYCNEEEFFERENQIFTINPSFAEGNGKKEQTRKDALFLSVCYSYNGSISEKLIDFFQKIHLFWPSSDEIDPDDFNGALEDDRFVDLMKLADPGILGFHRTVFKKQLRARNQATGEFEFIEQDVPSLSAVYHSDGKNHSLDIRELSGGTRKLMNLALSILRAMDNGRMVVIDEIDIQLHPLLIEALLNIFHSDNRSKAQLIYTTHNTYPLRQKRLRRDQIWFLDKEPDLSSRMVNFAEFKLPDGASYEDGYLFGRYGGIPLLDMPQIFISPPKTGKKGGKK